jgi:serine protease Do
MRKPNQLITTFLQALIFWGFLQTGLKAQSAAPSNNRSIRENAVVRAVRKVRPAVVNIRSESAFLDQRYPFSNRSVDPFFDSFFRDFFERRPRLPSKKTSLGSGVIIDGKKGIVLTNAHVVSNAGNISVALADENEYAAEIIGADPDSDLAVIKIVASRVLPDVIMQTVDEPMIGETVIAIGNPFGFSHSVTTGVISALNRSIHTDASINPGNSGGPLLNIDGDLIGINTAIYTKAQGIGFAIPIHHAQKIISDLITHGEVMPSWIGIRVQSLTRNMVAYLDLPSTAGVLVKHVDPDSPAKQADIREGDVILEMNHIHIPSIDAYNRVLRQIKSGDDITLFIWRNRSRTDVIVKATDFPQQRILEMAHRLLQIEVRNIPENNRNGTMAGTGVIIAAVEPGSYIHRVGIKAGDIIHKIDEMTIETMEDFKKAIMKSRHKNAIVLLLQRGRHLYYVPIRI